MENFHEVRTLLNDHVALFEELIQSEDRKLDAVAANDVDLLNIYMKEEQVFIMRLKGLDRKREQLLEELDMPGKTFSELIDLSDGEENEDLTAIFKALSLKINELQSATDSTKKFIDLHLHSLNNLLDELQPQDRLEGTKPGLFPAKKI